MTDSEMTMCCADLMGWHRYIAISYNPLHDDAQAMALVKKFNLHINWWPTSSGETWQAQSIAPNYIAQANNLNRAIVECVAKMKADHA
jgi:hypothetical protein